MLLDKNFNVFLGLDQTGALKSNRKVCKDLPACLIFTDSQSNLKIKSLQDELSLSDLSCEAISYMLNELSRKEEISLKISNLAILVDTVFGLPEKAFPESNDIYSLMSSCSHFSYGMAGGKAFFEQFDGGDGLLLRRCDEIAGANSVFSTYPMQRNVQTGTFRVWKDLSKAKDISFNLWPFCLFDKPSADLPWLFEAYPAGLAKTLLKLKNRKSLEVRDLESLLETPVKAEEDDINLITKSQDYKDALINAICGYLLNQQDRLIHPFDDFLSHDFLKKEGWMAGLNLV